MWEARGMSVDDWDWSQHVFDHVEVHASDYEASVSFYTTVLGPLGIPSWSEDSETERLTCFTRMNVVDRRPPTRGLHICFVARSREQVDAFHRAGVEAGFRVSRLRARLLRGIPSRSRREQRRSALPRRREPRLHRVTAASRRFNGKNAEPHLAVCAAWEQGSQGGDIANAVRPGCGRPGGRLGAALLLLRFT